MGEMQNDWTLENGRVTRRGVLLGAMGALGATAFLAACGSDDDGDSGSTTPAETGSGDTGSGDTTAPVADAGTELAKLLGHRRRRAPARARPSSWAPCWPSPGPARSTARR